MPRIADLPASKLIRFLAAYGPDENNQNLFDENVQKTSAKNGIAAFDLETNEVSEIVNILKSDKPTNILVAGVAGDGKSYHLRKVWLALGGSSEKWRPTENPLLNVELDSGGQRQVQFINDLSAYGESFQELWNQVCSTNGEKAFVIACNHGQILSRLREFDGTNALADKLEKIFFKEAKNEQLANLSLFDLSRTSQSENLAKIIQLICMQRGWNACKSESCEFVEDCPIRKNVSVLWNTREDCPTQATKRLCELVRVAAYDGAHIPVRELFMLAVNAILGKTSLGSVKDARSSVGATADCHLIRRMQRKEVAPVEISVCQNLLGGNLSKQARGKKSLFRRLDLFQVGHFSEPYFDNLILSGRNHTDPEKQELFRKYLSDLPPMPEETGAGEEEWKEYREKRNQWLEEARRRLFFRWNEPERKVNVWNLTAYQHVEDFLKLHKRVFAGESLVIDERLVEGFNRAFTGSPAHHSGQCIQITTNGASSRAAAGNLVVGKIHTDWDPQVRLTYVSRTADSVPVLEFFGPGPRSVKFFLTPRSYEFLLALAEGTLPSSFSEQCQAEFYTLKATLIQCCRQSQKSVIRLDLVDGQIIQICPENAAEQGGKHD